jgi:hypothetical protein
MFTASLLIVALRPTAADSAGLAQRARDELQGTWTAVPLEEKGVQLSPKEVKKAGLSVRQGRQIDAVARPSDVGPLLLHPRPEEKKPAHRPPGGGRARQAGGLARDLLPGQRGGEDLNRAGFIGGSIP